MATPEAPRRQIRDIERHEEVRSRGPKAPGVRRGLNTRGIRALREVNRPPHRYQAPSSMPLTQIGWAVLLCAVMLLIILAVAAVLFLR
jgi:hypothetical protein